MTLARSTLALFSGALLCLSAGAAEPTASESGSKVLEFPKNYSLGTFKIVNGRDVWLNAQASVRIPREAKIHLKLNYNGAAHMSDLKRLGPNDVDEIDTAELAVNDEDMRTLTCLSGLRSLNISQSEVGDRGLSEIARLKNIDYLNLSGVNITPAGARQLSSLTKLRKLRMGHNHLAEDGLVFLLSLKNLKRLDLNRDNLKDGCVGYLKNLTNLTSLNLADNKITDKALRAMPVLPSLEELILDNTWVQDHALDQFARFPKLRSVSLEECAVTDAGIEKLKDLPLNELNLRRTKVTLAGLKKLNKMKSLRSLKCSAETKELAALRRALPNCELKIETKKDVIDMDLFRPLK